MGCMMLSWLFVVSVCVVCCVCVMKLLFSVIVYGGCVLYVVSVLVIVVLLGNVRVC